MSDDVIYCDTCKRTKPKSIYMKIISGEWEGVICKDCIKDGTMLHANDGSILINFRERLIVPGLEEKINVRI